MKKAGIINADLIKHIAALGHMDLLMIGDAGMPIPKGVDVIDLALCKGVPAFQQVLDAVLLETAVEYYYIAEEIREKNSRLYEYIQKSMPDIAYETMPHISLKEKAKECRFAIRTGEFSPYPNIILRAGVVF